MVGDGTQTGDFVFIFAIIDGICQAVKYNVEGRIFNLGNGNTYSINRLVELLGDEVTHIPRRPGEPDCTFADIIEARKLLGYQPKVSFE